ncbi:MAG: nucleotidyltransferase family protein [Acidimicrobiia bacterium]|nr:nucleotidyltransferase family protein [Acidimicrobiia bacterium]
MSCYPLLVRAVTAEGLDGSQLSHPREPLPEPQWRPFMVNVSEQRLTGLLASAVGVGRFPVTVRQRAVLAELDAAAAAVSLRLDRALLEVADTFDGSGVSFRVLKGAALAHVCYPDPRQRPYGDVDVLVPSERFDDAVRLLVAAGGRCRFIEPRPGFTRRFGKGVSVRRTDGLEVDLHRTLASGPLGMTVDTDGLFEGATPFTVGGRELLGLGREERFLHACYHAVLGAAPPRALALRDVAQLALDPRLDVRRVHALLDRWHAAAVAAAAVRIAWTELQLVDTVPLSSFAATYQPSPRESRALAVYSSPRQRYPRQAAAALRHIPRVRDRAAYLAALLVPSRQYIAGRDRSYIGRLVRAVRTVRAVERGD